MGFKKGYIPWNKGKKVVHAGTFKKGSIPWNKGLIGVKKATSGSFKKGNKAHLGMKHSEETKEKISLNRKGKCMGEDNSFSRLEVREKMSRSMKGKNTSPKTQFKKGHKPSPEMIKKMLRRNKKSSIEIKFERIIRKYNLPYIFVGNGEVIIGGKCPDFVNTNGEKIAIEVFYKQHKEMFKGNLQKWMIDRQKIFNDYGWNLIFFDETQVNEKKILETIGGG